MLKLNLFTLNNINPFLKEVEKSVTARLQEVGLTEFGAELSDLDQYYTDSIAPYQSLFGDIETMGDIFKFKEYALRQVSISYVKALTESQEFKSFVSAHIFSIIKNCQDYDEFMSLLADFAERPTEFCINHRPSYPIPKGIDKWADNTERCCAIFDILDDCFLTAFSSICDSFHPTC